MLCYIAASHGLLDTSVDLCELLLSPVSDERLPVLHNEDMSALLSDTFRAHVIPACTRAVNMYMKAIAIDRQLHAVLEQIKVANAQFRRCAMQCVFLLDFPILIQLFSDHVRCRPSVRCHRSMISAAPCTTWSLLVGFLSYVQ